MSDPLPEIDPQYPDADFDTEPRALSPAAKIVIVLLIVSVVLLLAHPIILAALNRGTFPQPTPTPIPSLWEIA